MRHSRKLFDSEHLDSGRSEFGRLVGAIYDCLSADRPVQELLVLLAEYFHAEMVSLVLSSPRKESIGKILIVSRRSLGEVNFYEGQVIPLSSTRITQVSKSPLFPTSFSVDDTKKCKIYDLFLESVDFYNSYTVDLFDCGEGMTLLKIGRGRGFNHFSDIEKDLIHVLIRHIRQFMRLCNHIEHLEIERNIYHDVIDKFSLASIVLDQRGLVVHVNGSAEKLLRRTPELCIDSGRVVIDDFATQEKFEGILARMLAARHRDAPGQLETMRISREGHSLDMGLAIRPLAEARDISPQGAPAIAVFIRDAGLCSSAPISVVSKLFGLSPTESRVAVLLADGLSLVEITEFLGMAHATVRTHLRSVFKKMGVDRQALVVRLIITSVANLA